MSKNKPKEKPFQNLNRHLRIRTRHSEPKFLDETENAKLTKDQSAVTVNSFTTALSSLVDGNAAGEKSRSCSQDIQNETDVENTHRKEIIKQEPLDFSNNYECNSLVLSDSLGTYSFIV